MNDPTEFQDICSVVGVSNEFSTTEPFVESKYDIHVQKIGASYKAFMSATAVLLFSNAQTIFCTSVSL